MSRSYRKNPCFGITCCESEKEWKRNGNRALRRKNKVLLSKGNVETLHKKEVFNLYDGPKDGKCRLLHSEMQNRFSPHQILMK